MEFYEYPRHVGPVTRTPSHGEEKWATLAVLASPEKSKKSIVRENLVQPSGWTHQGFNFATFTFAALINFSLNI